MNMNKIIIRNVNLLLNCEDFVKDFVSMTVLLLLDFYADYDQMKLNEELQKRNDPPLKYKWRQVWPRREINENMIKFRKMLKFIRIAEEMSELKGCFQCF